jgi:hypothetical protein
MWNCSGRMPCSAMHKPRLVRPTPHNRPLHIMRKVLVSDFVVIDGEDEVMTDQFSQVGLCRIRHKPTYAAQLVMPHEWLERCATSG